MKQPPETPTQKRDRLAANRKRWAVKHEIVWLWGFRPIQNWTYIDPDTKDEITVTPRDFLTQPYCAGPHRCARFPLRDLYIPRCFLRPTRALSNKATRDDVLLGRAFPTNWRDAKHPAKTPRT